MIEIQMKQNILTDTAEIFRYRPFGITQNFQPQCFQCAITLSVSSIACRFKVLGTVQFDDQSGLSTVEIHDKFADDLLSVDCHRQTFEEIIP